MRNGKEDFIQDMGFYEQQLYDAQRSLFIARSVKEVKFLTSRINFLKQQLKSTGKRGKKNG